MASLINRAFLKEQLKRFWVIAAIPLLGYILTMAVPMYSFGEQSGVRQMVMVLSYQHPVIFCAAVVMPLFTALALFSHMFNPRAAIMINALPVSRKQIFFTNLAAGAILLLVPLLILSLFMLIPVRFIYTDANTTVSPMYIRDLHLEVPAALFPYGLADGQIMNTPVIIAGFFLRTALMFMFYFAVFSLASIVSGHGVVALLISAAFTVLPVCVYGLDIAIKQWLVVGFDFSKTVEETAAQVLVYSNPLGLSWIFQNGMYQPSTETAPVIPFQFFEPVYIVTAAALLATAYFCHRARRQERTGESVVFNGLKQVLIFLLSMAGSFVTFIFFIRLFESVPAGYAGFVLGFILAYFIAQMIAEKTFNVGYKLKGLFKFGAVMAVFTLIAVVDARMDFDGYQHYVPSAGEVTGVRLNYYDDNSIGPYNRYDWVTDGEIISRTVESHRSIISDMDRLRRYLNFRFRLSSFGKNSDEDIFHQRVYYRLKDGTVVSRIYEVPVAMMESSGFNELRRDERVILSDYPLLYHPEGVEQIRIEFDASTVTAGSEGYVSLTYGVGVDTGADKFVRGDIILDTAKFPSLLEALRKDAVEDGRAVGDGRQISQWQDFVGASFADGKEYNVNMSADIRLYENFERGSYQGDSQYYHLRYMENTVKWLRDNGYVIKEIELW